ncbi:Prolipoprotein diacylglyceryl transferase [Methylophilaceae bacterium 11]|uniref:prolipoprotein diacylglyceryl transferase n=1 Tax=Methylotenera sp. N17 TaxID=1502761 RepID=UPI00044991F9|nr:prolipoprotein diacylglyceryl transferase [Methylotenera sp. N17]EUJ09626.1 Prolipoprotein diacylglyceryl transferase [Methylophilaceae bacterium 11]
MLTHPQFNPVAIQITDSFGIHWYGLMYLIGFVAFLLLGKYQIKHKPWFGWNTQMLDDALFYGALGVILGGRIGYMLFYQFPDLIAHPLNLLKIWQGGMSFHGGFLGVLVAMFCFTKKHPQPWLKIMDFVAPLVPLGLGAGRMGNFINGELWGRPTGSDYGMIFPQVDAIARHPSQLYEFMLEGIVMFAVLWWFSRKQRPVGQISALFLIMYGSFRFLVEFTREPDAHLGLLGLGLSMGQWLSLPMMLIGVALFLATKRSSVK